MAAQEKPRELFKSKPHEESAQAKADQGDPLQEAATFAHLSGVKDVARLGYPVKCPLLAYAGLTVHFRTSNKTRVANSKPKLPIDFEYRAKLRKHSDMLAEWTAALATKDTEARERLDELLNELTAEINETAAKMSADLKQAQVRWLPNVAVLFEGWDFTLGGESLPEPNPNQPETYHILLAEFEDLFDWLVSDDPYKEALALSVKNSVRP